MAPLDPPNDSAGAPPAFAEARLLGEGAFGRVYAATDALGRRVAVKVLSPAMASDPEALWRFGVEHARLARLDHPAFPAALGEGRTPDGLPYYAMGLVVGRSLEGEGPWPASRVRETMGAIAAALAHLHGLGWVHGDLKSANVLVETSGAHRLIDLGLLAAIGERRDAVAGTLEYLAPEAWRLAPVDAALDMYALGVLGFALWTGRMPFTGGPAELARAHMLASPPALLGLTPDADPALAALLTALLAKDPAARPDATGVRAALGLAEASEPRLRLRAGAFVGRDSELDAAREALAAEGPASLTFVGDLGMGKTQLLAAIRPEAIAAGRAWVGARALGAGDAPAAALRSAIAQALALSGVQAGPVVLDWIAGRVNPALADLDPAARKAAMHRFVGQALEVAARRLGGLAVGLDDWHLADTGSLEALAACRRLDAPIAWFVATAAAVDGARTLTGLGADEVRALLAARLGAEPPEALVSALTAASGGVPLGVDRALEHAIATGRLKAEAGGWRYDAAAETASPDLQAMFTARQAAMSPPARALAAVLAIAAPAGDLPLGWLAEAAELAPDVADGAAAELAGWGLLAVTDARARLAVAEAAPALAAGLDAEARGAIATGLSRRLLGDTPLGQVGTDALGAAAALALEGDAPAFAATVAIEAGRRALALGASREALALLTAATGRLGPEAPAAEQRAAWLLRADAQRWLDAPAEAAASYERALTFASPSDPEAGAAWIDATLGLAKCRQLAGSYDEALALLKAAGERAEALPDAARQARAALAEARVRLYQGDSAGARERASGSAALARAAGAAALRSQALNLAGVLAVQADLAQADAGLAMLDEALTIAWELGDGRGMGVANDNMGNALMALGDLVAAGAAFAEAARLARELGTAVDALSPELNQAIALADRGAHAEAGDLAREVAERARAANRRFPMAAAVAVGAQAAMQAGRVWEAAPALDTALEVALAINNRYLEEFVRLLRLEAWLMAGDLERAAAESATVTALNQALGHTDVEARLACARGELARLMGDFDTARVEANGVVHSPNRLAAHRAHRLLAALDAAAGEGGSAVAHARSARAIAQAWQSPWHEAADALLEARASAAAGDSAGAAEAARAALALAEGPGHNPYVCAGAAVWLGDRAAVRAAADAWRPALEALGTAADALLAAHGLTALTTAPTVSPSGLDLARLAWAITQLGACGDEHAIADFALSAGAELVGAERGYVLLYDEQGRLAGTISLEMDAEAELAGGFSRTVAEHVLFSGEPLYLVDAQAAEGWREAASIQALALRTVIALPIATPRTVVGVLYLDRQAIEPMLAEPDVALLGAFAAAAADAVERERARAAAQRATDRLMACLQLSGRLGAVTDPVTGRLAVLEALATAAGAERAAWIAPGAEAPAAQWGQADAPVSGSVASWVAEHREPLGIWDVAAADGWSQQQSIQAMGLRTIWCLPVGEALLYMDAGRLQGVDPANDLPDLMGLVDAATPHLARWGWMSTRS